MKRTLLLLLLLMSSFACKSQDELIVGKWTNVKRTTKDGLDTTVYGKPFSAKHIFEFTKTKFIDRTFEPMQTIEADYVIQDKFIVINGRKRFLIEKITNTELVISEYNPKQSDEFLFRYYFKKG